MPNSKSCVAERPYLFPLSVPPIFFIPHQTPSHIPKIPAKSSHSTHNAQHDTRAKSNTETTSQSPTTAYEPLINRMIVRPPAAAAKREAARIEIVASHNADLPQCFLLNLAPELRNHIYDLVLLEDKHIIFPQSRSVTVPERTVPHHQLPALLCVSREIRWEASSVYYKGNSFVAQVDDFDITHLKKVAKGLQLRHSQLGAFIPHPGRLGATYGTQSNTVSWPKFFEWIEAFYNDEVPQPSITDTQPDKPSAVASMAFDILEIIKSPLSPATPVVLPWANVKQILIVALRAVPRVGGWRWIDVPDRKTLGFDFP